MWMLILITCVGFQCEKPVFLSMHSTREDCEKHMDAIEDKNGQYTKCQWYAKDE
jgi:hypothetical protein